MLIRLEAQEGPKVYVAYERADVIFVDGLASETSWDKALWSDDFIDIEGMIKPKYKTRMKMVYDEEYLYFYAEMEEPHIWATLKQRDTVIFYNNDFEIFIDPDGDTHNYYEFEMNALNTVWDLFLTKPYRNHGKIIDSWDIQGIKTAVSINGTLNNASDTDDSWSVEIAMPWTVITEASHGGKVPKGDFWRINFSRVNWDYDLNDEKYSRKRDEQGKFLPEYNWVWSPQWVINMHEPEHWGYVYFSKRGLGLKEVFDMPLDERIKWQLYSLYRKILKSKEDPEMTWKKMEGSKINLDGESIDVKFDKHLSGWNLSLVSPFSKKMLLIKEDGRFISSE